MDPILRQLIDERDTVSTINKLFSSADTRDWEAVASCFAPQVVLDMTSMDGGEPTTLLPSDITSMWDDGLKALQAVHHQAGNFAVTLDGDRARACCHGTAFHYLPNPSGRNTRTFVGTYDFELKRQDDGWVIDLLRFNLKFVDGNLNLEGV